MFYVYTYSSNDTPYYVGKGHRTRDQVHLNIAKNPKIKAETACIAETRRLLEANLPVDIVRVADGLCEDEAFVLERTLIAKFGRRQHGGLLVNRTSGGQGPSGVVRTLEQRARVGNQFRGKKLSEEHREKISKWTKANGVRPPLTRGVDHPRAKVASLKMPDGSVANVFCLKAFCQQNNINMSSLRNTLYQKRPLKKGPWAGLMLIAQPS